MTDYGTGRHTFHKYKNGNGAWQFGPVFWFNTQRAGFELHFGVWTVTWIREWR